MAEESPTPKTVSVDAVAEATTPILEIAKAREDLTRADTNDQASRDELARHFFEKEYGELHKAQAQVIALLAARKAIASEMNEDFERDRNMGTRVADKVATFGGSWMFIFIFSVLVAIWIVVNTFILKRSAAEFDPYPYIMLNLVLSMVSALQAPFIMMSQNRADARDRLDAAHDYVINLKADLEILNLHEKVDKLQTSQWQELVDFQQQQIQMLVELLKAGGCEVNVPGQPTTPKDAPAPAPS